MCSSPTQPLMSTRGVLEKKALATPVRALVNPGPAVTMATAGLRVILPQASAMKSAACSWRVSNNVTDLPSRCW